MPHSIFVRNLLSHAFLINEYNDLVYINFIICISFGSLWRQHFTNQRVIWKVSNQASGFHKNIISITSRIHDHTFFFPAYSGAKQNFSYTLLENHKLIVQIEIKYGLFHELFTTENAYTSIKQVKNLLKHRDEVYILRQ